jgi:hypothetical protein
MSDVEPEPLADVAYGLFEHTLNKDLRDSGACLFELVENNNDFLRLSIQYLPDFQLITPSLPTHS